MRMRQTFDRGLQIEIERCPYCAAQSRVSRHYCINKMRGKTQRIDVHDFRRLREEPLLILCNHSQFNEPRERPNVFAGCMLGMSPRIQTRRCLRKTSQKNCFAQSEISRWFVKVCASSGFRSDPAIAIAGAIQILGKNAFLTPASLQFPS